MKTRISKLFIVLIVLSSVLTMAATPNHHQINKTPFSGNEEFIGVVNFGTSKVIDGKTFTTGLVVSDLETMSDPRVSGNATVTVTSFYDGPAITGTGPLWGTIHLTNASGGWKIVFAGYQYTGCHDVVHSIGSGEGAYKGLKAVWDTQSSDCMQHTSVSGYIIENK